MPQKVLFGKNDFAWLEHELTKRGFHQVSGFEIRKDFERLGIEAPPLPTPKKSGSETGFLFYANGLAVRVWTTWLASEEQPREEDAGWVLICQDNRRLYVNPPFNRTKNFLLNLFRRAWIAQWRVLHRPLCPECNKFMDIVRGRALKARYWRCDRFASHKDGRAVCLDWDYGLPPMAKKMAASARRARAKYRAERKKEGKPLFKAMLDRSGR